MIEVENDCRDRWFQLAMGRSLPPFVVKYFHFCFAFYFFKSVNRCLASVGITIYDYDYTTVLPTNLIFMSFDTHCNTHWTDLFCSLLFCFVLFLVSFLSRRIYVSLSAIFFYLIWMGNGSADFNDIWHEGPSKTVAAPLRKLTPGSCVA